MPKTIKATKTYQKAGGNFKTVCNIPLKKEADLAAVYYPGIDQVLDKIQAKPKYQQKYCRLHRTVGVIGTKGPKSYPLLTAKAALLSQAADVNAIPLFLRYKKIQKLAEIVESMASNFTLIYLVGFSATEQKVFADQYKGTVPYLFDDQSEAAAVIAALGNASKMLGKTTKKVQIAIEGVDHLTDDIVHLLGEYQYENVTLLDERGALYKKRPNMNQRKNDLATIMKAKKDDRSRAEVLNATDIYLCSHYEAIKSSTTNQLPSKAVVISLKSSQIDLQGKQSVISTLPHMPNHLSDIHIVAGLAEALAEGKQWTSKTVSEAIKGLSAVYKAPKPARLFPGLLEKNLAVKIAKAVK